jgi:8-oxo-dGTP pyrophosphatase MutT (NUDIX family)
MRCHLFCLADAPDTQNRVGWRLPGPVLGMTVALAARYQELGVSIDAAGEWAVLVEPWAPTRPSGISRLLPASPVLDRKLRAAGDAHLDRLRQRGAQLHDGPVLALGSAIPGLLTLRPGSYFDHLRCAETLAAEWQAGAATPLRDRLDARAGGDPLHSGAGRCAALAVAALLVWGGPRGPEFVLGRRSERLAVGSGLWHVVPAGMVEPGPHPLSDALTRELSEEVSCEPGQAERAVSGASILGLAFGLERLQTEVGCLLILAGHRPMLDPEEHVESRWWPFSAAGLSAALEELGPDQLVPAAAGTLELARWRLASW